MLTDYALGTYDFDTVGTSIYCAVYGGSGIYRSTNNGVNWMGIGGTQESTAFGITHNNNYIFTATRNSGIYRTSNNGLNWTQVNSGLPTGNNNPRAITSKDNIIFVGFEDGTGVYRSTNNGENWIRTDTTLNDYLVYKFSVCGQYIFVSTNSSIYRTSNNGDNWQKVSTGIPNYIGWTICTNGTNIFTAGSTGVGIGGAYISTDFGNNWNLIYAGGYTVFSSKNLVFVSSQTNFLVSTNNGINWVNKYNNISGYGSSIITIYETNNFVFAGGVMGNPYTPGTLIWRRPINELTDIKNISANIPCEYNLSQNYPNPFNPTTNIKYQITNNKLVTLKIYDILGKEVVTLVNEMQQPGTYEINWDASTFPGGVYFYKLSTENFSETKKMFLIK